MNGTLLTIITLLPFLTGRLSKYSLFTQYSLKDSVSVTRIAYMHRPVAFSLAPPKPTTQSATCALARIRGIHVAKVQEP